MGMSTDARYQQPSRQGRSDDQWTDRWGGWSDYQWRWDERNWQDEQRWSRPAPTGRSRSPQERMTAGRSRSPPARMRPRSRSRVPPSPHPTDCEEDPTDDDDDYVQEVQQQQACERDDAFFPRRRPYIPPQRVLDGRRPVYKPRGQSSAEAGQSSAASGEAAVAASKWQQMPRISILGINLGGRRRRTDLREFICNSAMHICLCLELIQATDAEFFEAHGIGFVGDAGCSVLWRKTVFACESFQEHSTQDTDGQWGVAAVAARLIPNLDCGHLGPLTLGAAHIRNTLAKRPVAVLPHLEALELFFQSAEADIGYIDANQAAFSREHEMAPIDATFTTLKGWLKSPTHTSLLARCPMDAKRGQCTGFLWSAASMSGRAEIWSHGTWIIQHGEQIAVGRQDCGYHNPSFLHLQTKGIAQGFRRRSDEAIQRRKARQKERTRGQAQSTGKQSRWGGSSYASSDRWGDRTHGSDNQSQWSWPSWQDDWQARWSTQEDRDGQTSEPAAPPGAQPTASAQQPYYRPSAKRTPSQAPVEQERRGFTYYEQQASQGPDRHVDEARAKARSRRPESTSQASTSGRTGTSVHAAEAASSSRAPPRSSTPAGKGYMRARCLLEGSMLLGVCWIGALGLAILFSFRCPYRQCQCLPPPQPAVGLSCRCRLLALRWRWRHGSLDMHKVYDVGDIDEQGPLATHTAEAVPRQIPKCAFFHCSIPPTFPLRCLHLPACFLRALPRNALSQSAEAVFVLARYKVFRSTFALAFCLLATGAAMGSQNDSASSTPSHLFQEHHAPAAAPQVIQGASYHPMSDLHVIDQGLELFPGDEVLLADRARLVRQAHRLWQLHTSGAIPPLNGQVQLELTLVLGIAHPELAETPLFPYVDRQSRKRSLHVHTVHELQTNAEAAEARHRRRHIAPVGHAKPLAAEAVKRRRRVIPPKRGRWHRALSKQRRNMPLEEDPIEDFSPHETPGLSSTDVLPAAGISTGNTPNAAEAVINNTRLTGAAGRPADTLVDSTDVNSSVSSPAILDRHTSAWPELAEEEELSSGNSTVSTSSTVRYDSRMCPSIPPEGAHLAAEAVGQHPACAQPPSMSCMVPARQRDDAIEVASHTSDSDDRPLLHLVNAADHLSPLVLAFLVLGLQFPHAWNGLLDMAFVGIPPFLARCVARRLLRKLGGAFWSCSWHIGRRVPYVRPKHRFAQVRIGEAKNPGPARQSQLSFVSSTQAATSVGEVASTEVEDTNMDQHTPSFPAEAAIATEVLPHGAHALTGEISESVWVMPSTESNTPDMDAPRGMHDPAPISRRQRRSHDVRPAETGRTHPSSLPP
eukprot:2610503-Amphidinium_carterae.2